MLPRRHRFLVACGVLVGCIAPFASAQSTAATECVADLDDLAPYMLANDAGARDHVAQKGQAAFDAAFAAARAMAAVAESDDSCLRHCAATWRRFARRT